MLRPETLDAQLNEAASRFLVSQIEIDTSKTQVVLPKVCDVYRNDFGGESSSCLSYCEAFLDESHLKALKAIGRRREGTSVNIKFHPCADQYHTLLKPVLD